jgi:hypothetical protein
LGLVNFTITVLKVTVVVVIIVLLCTALFYMRHYCKLFQLFFCKCKPKPKPIPQDV